MTKHLRNEELIPYLDGRLAAAKRVRLDLHLAACAACRARLEEFRGLLSLLGEWKAVEPSPGFDAALRAQIGQVREAAERARQASWFGLRPAFGAALAVAVLLAGAVGLWQLMPPASVAPPEVAQTAPPETGPVPETIEPALPPATETEEDLAVLDNPVLLENYELLEEFDVLFELLPKEEEKL